MFKKLLFTGIALILPLMSSAQKTVTASGSYTYYAPMNIPPDQAEMTAIERAKISIIENEWGTVMGVRNFTEVENHNGKSSVKYLSLGESEVKGEWIETIGSPTIKHEFKDNLQVITVDIKGRIREITSSKISFESKILRNGIHDKYESAYFKDADDFFVTFQAPIDGYVTVYLYDKDGVSRLLPFKYNNIPAFKVTANSKYVFFANGVSLYSDIKDLNSNSINAEYALTCNTDNEVNRFYIIFSPNKFTKAVDKITDTFELPAFLDFQEFQKWLTKCRRQDTEMTVRIFDICISK